MKRKKILIFGATSSIVHQLARLFNDAYYCDFILVGRNLNELNKNKSDLLLRNKKSSVKINKIDFISKNFMDSIKKISLKNIDLIIMAHGLMNDSKDISDFDLNNMNTLNINSFSRIINYIHKYTRNTDCHLVIFGSVAGDRSRQSNFWYGATKNYLDFISQGISHYNKVSKNKSIITIVKPGPTLTKMTVGLKNSASFASVEIVGKQIFNEIEKKKNVIYAPAKWKFIMFLIKHLPNFIFNKLKI